MQPKLGILAGGGKLPALIVEICRLSGRSIHVIKFKGYADEIPSYVPSTEVRLGAGGKTIKVLRENDVKEIILAGSVSRPSFTQLRPDAWGIKFLARTGAISLSDHSLFTAILGAIEGEGFRIVGVADTAPQLLADIGQISSRKPNEKEKKALKDLVKRLKECKEQMNPEAIQTIVYSVGKDNGYKENLRDWFKAIYEIIFGDKDGPRMGFFISFFGVKETIELINKYIK